MKRIFDFLYFLQQYCADHAQIRQVQHQKQIYAGVMLHANLPYIAYYANMNGDSSGCNITTNGRLIHIHKGSQVDKLPPRIIRKLENGITALQEQMT